MQNLDPSNFFKINRHKFTLLIHKQIRHQTKHPRTSMINIQGPCPLDSPRSPKDHHQPQVSTVSTVPCITNRSHQFGARFQTGIFQSPTTFETKLDGPDELVGWFSAKNTEKMEGYSNMDALQPYSYLEDVTFLKMSCCFFFGRAPQKQRFRGSTVTITVSPYVLGWKQTYI